MRRATELHDDIIRTAVESRSGYVFTTAGDSFAAAFHTATDALAVAEEIQSKLVDTRSATGVEIRVRTGLHTGVADERDGDYFGRDVNQAARVMDAGHGGQILVSGATAALLADEPLVDHGEHALRDLESSVHLFELARAPAASRGLRTLSSESTNLPTQRSSFVGREAAQEQVVRKVRSTRMVTLTGVGGIGKTRLAVQSAADVLPDFGDGCWFVGLASAHDTDGFADLLGAALSIPKLPGIDPLEACLRRLADQSALLVVDNCEHMIDSAADVCEEVLARAPAVHILATSREGLGIEGEQILAVRSLEVGDQGAAASDAVSLFVDRARLLKTDYEPSVDDAEAIRMICARLDGMPLAIELAAARIATFTPEEILVHLEDRFSLLTGGRRRARGRHQALRSTIDWSYGLLSPTEQIGFRRLSAFASSFDFSEAQAAVTSSPSLGVADLLDGLVAKSLLEVEPLNGGTRYRFLETIRQYGEQLLEDADEVNDVMNSLGSYYASWAQDASSGLVGPDEVGWIGIVELEVPNLRRLVDWAIDNDEARVALGVVAPFSRCINMSSHMVGPIAWSAWEAFNGTELAVACEAFAVAAEVPFLRDDLDATAEVFSRVTAIAEETGAHVPSSLLNIFAQIHGTREPGRGYELAVEALQRSREDRDSVWEVMNFTGVVVWGMSGGDLSQQEAAALSEQAMSMVDPFGPTVRATASFCYAFARTETDPADALEHFQEAIDLAAPGTVVHDAGLVFGLRTAIELGNPEGAAEMLLPVLDDWITFDRDTFLDFAIVLAGAIAASRDDSEDAQALVEFGASLSRLDVLFPRFLEMTRDSLKETPSPPRSLSRDEAITLTREVLQRS